MWKNFAAVKFPTNLISEEFMKMKSACQKYVILIFNRTSQLAFNIFEEIVVPIKQ